VDHLRELAFELKREPETASPSLQIRGPL
jgi:hypothetical protein